LTVCYSNSLEEVHVKIGPKEKCPDTNNTLYSVVLSLPQKKTRAVYFDNIADQESWFQILLSIQGFETQIEQYKLEKKPFWGGEFSSVWRGKHRITKQEVAVKAMEMNVNPDHDSAVYNEAKILYKCSHPFIIRCLEVFEVTSKMYVVTEYCKTGDLQQY